MKKIDFLKTIAMLIVITQLSIFGLVSCTNDDESTIDVTSKDKTEIFIERINMLLDRLTNLYENAVFGEKKGEYPITSKKLIENQITLLNETLAKLKDGTKKISNSDMDNLIVGTYEVETTFKESVRTEDFQAVPAELHVNGKNGGYIDFGSHPEFSAFSDGFTVDLWFKFSEIGSFDYILSTFIDNDNPTDRYRQGWCINYYGEGGAKNLRMTYSLGKEDLYEPWVAFQDIDKWVHIAMVWNPLKINDGSGNPKIFKMYLDGSLIKEEDWGLTNYTPNTQGCSMIGFNYTNFDGSIKADGKGANGYMKYVHIWNSVKSQSEVQTIMNNPESVKGTESDIVCGWNLDKTISDVDNIQDLTGKYTAKLVGSYEWITK